MRKQDKTRFHVPFQSMNRLLQLLLTMALLAGVSLPVPAVQESQPSPLELTQQEQQWLRDHPVIRHATESNWPPYEFIDQYGRLQGLSADILKLVEQRLGIEFRLLPNSSWVETLERTRRREIDLLSSIVQTPEREKFLLFSDPYVSPAIVVFTRQESDPINSMQDLNRRTVVIENQYSLHEQLARGFSQIRLLPVETTADALKALSSGRADAYIGNEGSTKWIAEQNALTNLRAAYTPAEFGDNSLRLAVRSDWPILGSIINKALASIPDPKILEIRRRWLGAGAGAVRVEMTAEERSWLAEHSPIRFAGDPNWLPYEAVDPQGNYIGIAAEHLKLVQEKLGMRFEFVPTETWSESVAKAIGGEIDVISETDTSELTEFFSFTKPYLSSPVVIVMKEETGYIENISQIADRRIAVIRQYGYLPQIREKYPRLDYQSVDSIQDGLAAVSTGKVDALLATLAQASYHIGELGINIVRIVGKTEFDTRLGLGVRKSLAPLVPLLNRAMDSIDKGRKQQILDTWGRQRFAVQTDYRRLAIVAVFAISMLAVILLWAYSIRRQKERLRISEERFQLALDAASVGLWDWNAVTDRVFYSPLWMSMLGYGPNELPHTFETFHDLLHPDDREATLANNQQMLKDPDTKYEQEFRLRCKDGSYRWILSRGHVFSRDSEGNAVRALGIHSDITQRKQAEIDIRRLNQSLMAANERFSLAAKAITLGVWERAADGSNYLLFDDRMFEIYGLERCDRIPVRRWLKLVHPEDRERVTASIRKALTDGGDAYADFRAYHSDGTLRYIYAAVTAIKSSSGDADQLFGVNWDITDRKEAEKQFERVLNALPVSVAISDPAGGILLANPEAENVFGGGRSLVGRQTGDYYADPDQRLAVQARLRQDGQVLGMEIRYRTDAGDRIDGLLSAIPIVFDSQPALLGVVVNISERRRMERALAQAKEQAEEANRFKGRFLANMSHEIRTPMNAIVGLGHLLNRTTLTPKQQDYLGKIQISARSLLNIIDDILDFSKIEAGQLRIEEIDFELNDVLDNIATLASTQLAEKPVEFLYDIEPAVPSRLRGDPHRLTQILTNLVGNATKFTSDGGIVVRIRSVRSKDPTRIRFTVVDTGIGIAPDQLDHLFAPFIQADGSTTREYGGTGLGLSICRQLSQLMGGTLEAHSRPGEGSRFELEIPFGVASSESRVRPASHIEGLRVLLVDDNSIARQVLADLLLSLSFRVDVATGGTPALEKLKDQTRVYDLVLLDWRMPEMDGFETARRIEAAELAHRPRIIMMTAYGREAVEQALDLSGIDGFLIKPITPSHLVDSINQAIQQTNPEPVDGRLESHTGHELPGDLRGEVLLVEDNLINQQVARELLEQMGVDVCVCENGRQALARIRARRPDLVLMDIQMPDMDGYETTAEIRKMAGMGALPIVAMTANAMAGDAERSLEAGMNGHIAKPVDPEVLHATLAAWLGPDDQAADDAPSASDRAPPSAEHGGQRTPSPIAAGPSAAIGASGYRHKAGIDFAIGEMRVGGNRELFGRLLRDFAVQYRDAAQRLELLCQDGDQAAAERLLHSLKGVAGNIGATALQESAAELDRKARLGDLEAVGFGLAKFKPALELALADVQRFVASCPTDSAAQSAVVPLPESETEMRIAALTSLLEVGDAEAIELVSALATNLMSDTRAPLLTELERRVRNYDFEAARETLAQLRSRLEAGSDDSPTAG